MGTTFNEASVRESFARVEFLKLLGARLVGLRPGEVDVELPFKAELAQQHGFAHGGAIATVLDAASGYAALSLMSPGSRVLSVEFKVNLAAPAVGERFIARARVLRAGKTLTVTHAECHAVAKGEEKLVAAMQGTMIRLPPDGEMTG